jgi:hypothetical protein
MERGEVKHVFREGARYHVLNWTMIEGPRGDFCITRCSHPLCEMNFHAARSLAAQGVDAGKYVPAVSEVLALPSP